MQINFKAKKLQEANRYVQLLNPSNINKEPNIKHKASLLKKIFNFLFR
ncbi:MAG: Unknown protein [uncultured Sulfurovum sp.]|uniref:Uncharacterized protein n=1 Tax=uncultured Sulfurovum sp. TaxID=269237 RepID=A0A6S6T1T3_9BACT|nr:MAG: Unknown protein [uncultured Sulfurovum sp.]